MLLVLRVTTFKSIGLEGKGHTDQVGSAIDDPGYKLAEFIAVEPAVRDDTFHGEVATVAVKMACPISSCTATLYWLSSVRAAETDSVRLVVIMI